MHNITLRNKYTLALVLTGLFGVISYFITIFLIQNNSHSFEDINLLGKERMLSGKILFYTNEVYHHYSYTQVEKLKKAITEFKEVESTLKSRGYIFEQDGKKEFFTLADSFVDFFNEGGQNWNEEKGLEIDFLISAQYEKLLNNIDSYISKVQKENEDKIKYILIIKIILFILLVALLIAQAIFIFIPAEEEIKEKSRELEDINRDLQERVDAEVAKNKEKALQIIHQSRLATMGEMVSMIAHQWRQPLSSISTISGTLSLDVMMENYNADFFQKELESIDELAQHLSSTIDDFRNFFKTDKELHNEKIKDIVKSSFKIIAPTLEAKKIRFENNIEDGIFVNTYVSEIKQVLLNIMKNAEDVLVEKEIQNPTIYIEGSKNNGYAEIVIEDNAGGISPEIINRIFEPYFTTKKSKDGTGLGLYMSKIIVEEHCKGKLSVENGKDGAKFTIKLPLSSEHTGKRVADAPEFN
ncbi:MAG: HAMP domain-containing sensor histidine kinase [Sulfurimonas sp.]|uniref:sensor histidine kinase n=1 Tax=Sulfurimonas sp. TaxID=2022749 RepID=UPI0028CD4B81|nr:HAMP domain-containing sensor histidine kinase [Sulfurimonas sp.]MDT8337645.1 HAMP domain-containing sensor histidine kinase [Sulfurimonas sp.]